ncbi:hypothetical protein N5T77_10485 [Aliarcobacter cryaerophilus]|uniref:hypothetical protein n=1 Tax=Aliarcobacter cryaerophilus TaxID=28198 RepID=UPI00112F0D33|nr:hypothetical protein [Aliarcobacter cryaerophilus]MCT7525477.1 hypothetical protein [Aliarcobacter cryaerophilus]
MSKISHYLISLFGLFFFTGCLLIDPKYLQPKSGIKTMKGTVKNISYHKSPGSNYYVVKINSKDSLSFEEDNPVTETSLAQIQKNDYINYYINYDTKIIIMEITKKSEENCKINITSEFDENFNQRVIKSTYLEKLDKKGVDICAKYSLKESLNIINISGQNQYLD